VQPQAMLRSVVVVEFVVDRNGKLLKSGIRRSNRDRESEATALASLRASAPLPKPPADLVRTGRLELNETWLFNDDGRFQIRSTALRQLDQ
jgi:protein TonB